MHVCMYVCIFCMYACMLVFVHISPQGVPTKLFQVPASASRLLLQRSWYMLSCMWDGEYQRTLDANRKEYSGGQGFPISLSECSFGPTP